MARIIYNCSNRKILIILLKYLQGCDICCMTALNIGPHAASDYDQLYEVYMPMLML